MTMQQDRGQSHQVAAVITWVLGVVSALLTVFLGYLTNALRQEWSGYVGGESQVALFILAACGALTLLFWILTFVALAKYRSRDAAAKVLGVVAIMLIAVMAVAMVI